jgi:hypothetical protein
MVRLPILLDEPRPVTRGDCMPGGVNEQRPCPYVSCKYSLALYVGPLSEHSPPKQSIRTDGLRALSSDDDQDVVDAWGDRLVAQLEAMPETCALDVADRGGIGQHLLTKLHSIRKQALQQIEAKALRKVEKAVRRKGVRAFGVEE